MRVIKESVEFQWDKGNINKNLKHNVADKEAEEIFGSGRKVVSKDEKHSLKEERYMLWGKTNVGRKLTVFFTLRKNKVRIISARDMSRKEDIAYEKKIQSHTKVQK